MATEIERKFLVNSALWQAPPHGKRLTQGYLSRDPDRTVRVRVVGECAFMTVKSRRTGLTRTEIEFPIALEHAQDLLALCFQPLIDKTRHEVLHEGMLWEVDIFHGEKRRPHGGGDRVAHGRHAFLPARVGRRRGVTRPALHKLPPVCRTL